jgi:FkbM family methyltransferase
MAERQVSPKVAMLVVGATIGLALLAVGGTWYVESKKDLVAQVPGLGKFVIRDPKDVIQAELFLGKPWEPEAVPIFEAYVTAGGSVADIGAYNGVHAIRFANMVGPAGHVYAFEPNPKSFDMLKTNVALNHVESRVTLYPVGVADVPTTAHLVTPGEHNQGATNTCSDEDVRAHRRNCDKAAASPIQLIRVDDDVQRWFPTKVSFVKIDVEGYEEQVLKGSKAWLLRDHPAIWIEIWDDALRKREKMTSTTSDIVALLGSYGYRIEIVAPPWDYLFVPVDAPHMKLPASLTQ